MHMTSGLEALSLGGVVLGASNEVVAAMKNRISEDRTIVGMRRGNLS